VKGLGEGQKLSYDLKTDKMRGKFEGVVHRAAA
jgi:hypothetical protein